MFGEIVNHQQSTKSKYLKNVVFVQMKPNYGNTFTYKLVLFFTPWQNQYFINKIRHCNCQYVTNVKKKAQWYVNANIKHTFEQSRIL